MPKPTRRERRQLAEKGKLTPRRPALRTAPANASSSAQRSAAAPARLMPEEDAVAVAQEYTYVKADLLRILVLALVLVGTMIGLRIVLPQ